MQAANNYTYDEIQIGLANCTDGGDPVVWLNDNWQKLMETVQTLATKYGQEHKENIVGTISTREAREALKKHKGNVWQAVTECIEQRRLAFNAIRVQGNYSRDDIVTCLTQHQGNVDLALNELNRSQLKPFLLKIFGSPSGAENQSVAAPIEPESFIDDNDTGTISRADEERNDILRDIEAIIGNMEEKQSKQTETILQTIESLVGNMMMATTSTQNSQPISSSASSFSVASYDRIDVKSPVQLPKQQMRQSTSIGDSDTVNVENDVRQFVTSHIQDIVPDIAALVNKELNESEEATTVRINDGSYNYVDDDDDDDTTEYEDAIIELVLENPEESETPVDGLKSSNLATNVEPDNESGAAVTQKENAIASNENEERIVEQNLKPNVEVMNQIEDPVSTVVKRSPSVKRPKFAVGRAFQRSSLRQSDRRRIRELERQLKIQQQQHQKSGSRLSGYLSDSTVVPDENIPDAAEESQMTEIIDAEVRTFSFLIIEHEHVETEQMDQAQEVRLSSEHIGSVGNSEQIESEMNANRLADEESAVEMITKDAKNRNLSEIVRDTKELIQKMKNEIDEDIAMSASEFDGDDSVSYENESDYSDEFGEEEQESIEFDENEFDDSDGWTDIDDDEDDKDLSLEDGESIHTNQENNAQSLRSSQSIESAQFVEAQEEMVISGDEPQVQSDVVSDLDMQQEEKIDNESATLVEDSDAVNHVEKSDGGVEIVDSTEITWEDETPNENFEIDAEYIEEEKKEPQPLSIDSVDYLENIIEIQHSLQTSFVRESPIIEKASVEPSENIAMPDNTDPTTANEDTVGATAIENSGDIIETVGADAAEHSKSPHSLAKSASESSEGDETDVAKSMPENTPEAKKLNVAEVSEPVIDDQVQTTKPLSNESLVETFKYNKITVPVTTQCSQTNINVIQLKKGDANRNKIPVRRPSFTEPSASIRNLQNELFNKHSKALVKPVAKKPSKIVPPKLFFKETTSTKKVDNKNHIALAIASTSSKALPKKKYYETCFSDDYQTSDDEKPIGSSKKVIPNLVKIVETRAEDTVIDADALARRFMDEGLIENYLDAALAVELIQMKFDEKTAIAAAVECNSLEQAIAFLRQECELCTETYPMNKIVSMLKCTHSCCEECAKNYFTIQVSDVGGRFSNVSIPNGFSFFMLTDYRSQYSRLFLPILQIARVECERNNRRRCTRILLKFGYFAEKHS